MFEAYNSTGGRNTMLSLKLNTNGILKNSLRATKTNI
jgi:hypothetical protein